MAHHPIERPREYLDQINELRFRRATPDALDLAGDAWDSWRAGTVVEPLGLGALLQVAFLAALQDGHPSAQLWRARAQSVSAQTGEINTTAMLLLPVMGQAVAWALQARLDHDSARERALLESALGITDEVGELAQQMAKREEDPRNPALPGVSLVVVQRAAAEKRGYVLWRATRYGDASMSYQAARRFCTAGTRDDLRVRAGMLLCELGDGHSSTVVSPERAADRCAALRAEAIESGWTDVADRLLPSITRLSSGGPVELQDLTPIEIE